MRNNKSLGQHWLNDRVILDYIADCALVDGVQTVLEIGPGLGTLTSSLLKRFDKVTAVEFDHRLAANLPKSFPGKNLEVINADILKFDLSRLPRTYVVAGNIPYYITSPIILKLLEAKNLPARIVLLIQKEVAARIAAEDGRESVLSLSVKNRAAVELGDVVPKAYFTPPPKVDSQVIILTPHAPLVGDDVLKLIKLGFSAPRKKLLHNLASYDREELLAAFATLGLSPDARPADLPLPLWQSLHDLLKDKN